MPFSKDDFHHIRSIQIKATHHVNDLFAGMYRSIFKGRGLEFEDVREYQEGDDIRSIDWNVSARMEHLYVKNFREERELTVMLVVDVSASSRFGHLSHQKSEIIAEIGALLAFSAIKNQDKVGLLLFSEEIELYLKPKKGIRHVLRVIRELLYFKPRCCGTNLQKALAFLGRVQKTKTICFIISDFLTDHFDHELTLTSKRHECIAVQIYDPYERQFPKMGLMNLRDLESNEMCLIDSSDETLQKQFSANSVKHAKDLKQMMRKAGVDLVTIDTTESYTKALHRFFKQRGGRR